MNVFYIENQLFTNVTLMAQAIEWECLVFCPTDYYPKMGGRNRFRLISANGPALLSVPLVGGRDQRTPAGLLKIDYSLPWQRQHWRTIVSAYNRSPFFEYYAPAMEVGYQENHELLWDFNLSWWHMLKDWLGIPWRIKVMQEPPQARNMWKTVSPSATHNMPRYQQVFGSGFVPNLSILDALFNLGPDTKTYLFGVLDWLKSLPADQVD